MSESSIPARVAKTRKPALWPIIPVALSLLATVYFCWQFSHIIYPVDGWFPGVLPDFKNVWLAGHLWRADDFVTLTDPVEYNLHRAMRFTFDAGHVWSFPLHFILMTLPFSYLPFLWSALVWTILGAVAYALLMTRLGQTGWAAILLTLTSSGVFLVLFFGQSAFFFAALLWGGLLAVPASPVLAGVMFGLLSVKPQIMLFPGILLLTGRAFRPIGIAFLVAAVLVGVTTLIIGIEPWQMLFSKTAPYQTEVMFERRSLQPYAITWYSAIWRLTQDHTTTVAVAVQSVVTATAVAACIAVGLSRRAWRERVDACMALALAGLPYVLSYDLLLILPLAIKVFLDRETYGRAHRVTALLVIGCGPIGILIMLLDLFPYSQTLLLLFAAFQVRHLFRQPPERLESAAVAMPDPIPLRSV